MRSKRLPFENKTRGTFDTEDLDSNGPISSIFHYGHAHNPYLFVKNPNLLTNFPVLSYFMKLTLHSSNLEERAE